jgi:hypothetical protein
MSGISNGSGSSVPTFVDARLPAAVAVTGWVVGAVASALMTLWWVGESRVGTDLDDADFPDNLITLMISGAVMVYLGFMWWASASCVNARRIRPLAGSPFLPIWVYVGGPLLAGASAVVDRRSDLLGDLVLLVAGLTVALGHWIVVGSLRSTARRVGAATKPFTRLMWLPVAVPIARSVVIGLLGTRLEPDDAVTLQLATSPVLGLVLAAVLWHASRTFDQACRSDVIRRTDHELPSGDVVAAALRRSIGV